MNLAFRAHSSTLNGMACALCHCSAIFTTLHKVYVRLGLFTQAGKVLNTAQHKGLLDISDTDKSQPFEIRILDNSTLRASASLTHFLLNATCCHSCRTDWQRNFAVATNTLRSMRRTEDAAAYFQAICDVGVASAVHYGKCCVDY
jgi:hypothetical protein